MIDHVRKCIFIHIPRCGGTSIEKWLRGRDWWLEDPPTKHLLASQAKLFYRDYWDAYFKFSFVRHPLDRVISCLKFPHHFGIVQQDCGDLDFSRYHKHFGNDVVLEFDHRFYKRREIELKKHVARQVYSNILDEEIDFIGKFEALHDDIAEIGKLLGVSKSFDVHVEASARPLSLSHVSKATTDAVRELYESDLARFGYSIDVSS